MKLEFGQRADLADIRRIGIPRALFKSAGCTPEIDVMPVLQRLSRDYHIPVLFLTFDTQTSDAGLDTCLEAFYDMIAMRKVRPRRHISVSIPVPSPPRAW